MLTAYLAQGAVRAPYLSFGEIREGSPEVVTSKFRPVGSVGVGQGERQKTTPGRMEPHVQLVRLRDSKWKNSWELTCKGKRGRVECDRTKKVFRGVNIGAGGNRR